MGQDGVINQAKDAKTQTNNKQEEEQMGVKMVQAVGNSDLSREVIEEELKDLIDTQVIIGNGPWIVKGKSGVSYTVGPDGSVTEMSSEEVGIMEASTIADKKGKILSDKSIVTIKDSLGNYVRVPKGFKIAEDSGTSVKDGIVIEDKDKNQFVWVPVGTVKTSANTKVTIPLGRYEDFTGEPTPKQGTSKGYVYTTKGHVVLFKFISGNVENGDFYEFASDAESKSALGTTYNNTKAKDIKGFVKSANTNGGYYIGRYEAGVENYDTNKIPNGDTTNTAKNEEWTGYAANGEGELTMVCQKDKQVWNYITQKKAASLSQNMYTAGSGVESDLMNSYAWDTAIIYIQQCGGNSTYYNQVGGKDEGSGPEKTGQGKLPSQNNETTTDEQCKIYDMAGNVKEWSTESYTSSSVGSYCVGRGGCSMSFSMTSDRAGHDPTWIGRSYGFRPILYL